MSIKDKININTNRISLMKLYPIDKTKLLLDQVEDIIGKDNMIKVLQRAESMNENTAYLQYINFVAVDYAEKGIQLN